MQPPINVIEVGECTTSPTPGEAATDVDSDAFARRLFLGERHQRPSSLLNSIVYWGNEYRPISGASFDTGNSNVFRHVVLRTGYGCVLSESALGRRERAKYQQYFALRTRFVRMMGIMEQLPSIELSLMNDVARILSAIE